MIWGLTIHGTVDRVKRDLDFFCEWLNPVSRDKPQPTAYYPSAIALGFSALEI